MTPSGEKLIEAACDLCGSTARETLVVPSPQPLELPGPVHVVRCLSCGWQYTNPRPAPVFLGELYRKYYNTVARAQPGFPPRLRCIRPLWHAWSGHYLSRALRELHGRVLDVGCGTGDLLDELRRTGCDAVGIEPNPDSVETCRRRGLNVVAGELGTVPFDDGSFDGVVLWHVLEHVPSAVATLEAIRRLLKKGGVLVVYSPNAGSAMARLFGPYWINWHIPYHLNHLTAASVRRCAAKCGFSVRELTTATPDQFIAYSIAEYGRNKSRILDRLNRWRVFDSLAFRFCAAPVLRVADLLMPGKGECLQAVLVRE